VEVNQRMPSIWVTLLLILGAVGLYLLMTRAGSRGARLALLPLVAAAGALAALLTPLAPGGAAAGGFYVFALISLWSAMRVITHRKPVYAALHFILVIVASAGMMVLLGATFLAAALVIIYAGAILVTYVFVIMLAQQAGTAPYDARPRDPLLGVFCGFAMLTILTTRLFGAGTGEPVAAVAPGSTALAVGTSLLTDYVVGLQIAGAILTAAMVGAIAIAQRKTADESGIEGGE
jgi:NADH-quinone oxidoreductase subunit J